MVYNLYLHISYPISDVVCVEYGTGLSGGPAVILPNNAPHPLYRILLYGMQSLALTDHRSGTSAGREQLLPQYSWQNVAKSSLSSTIAHMELRMRIRSGKQ